MLLFYKVQLTKTAVRYCDIYGHLTEIMYIKKLYNVVLGLQKRRNFVLYYIKNTQKCAV